MNHNIVHTKSFNFAIRIIDNYKKLVSTKKEYILSKQLLRSGTAIGALIREAEMAESKKDFIHKMSIALKEANETVYWIQLLSATKYLNQIEENGLLQECKELVKLLVKIVKTSKERLKTN